jgi:hypothetical protein
MVEERTPVFSGLGEAANQHSIYEVIATPRSFGAMRIASGY